MWGKAESKTPSLAPPPPGLPSPPLPMWGKAESKTPRPAPPPPGLPSPPLPMWGKAESKTPSLAPPPPGLPSPPLPMWGKAGSKTPSLAPPPPGLPSPPLPMWGKAESKTPSLAPPPPGLPSPPLPMWGKAESKTPSLAPPPPGLPSPPLPMWGKAESKTPSLAPPPPGLPSPPLPMWGKAESKTPSLAPPPPPPRSPIPPLPMWGKAESKTVASRTVAWMANTFVADTDPFYVEGDPPCGGGGGGRTTAYPPGGKGGHSPRHPAYRAPFAQATSCPVQMSAQRGLGMMTPLQRHRQAVESGGRYSAKGGTCLNYLTCGLCKVISPSSIECLGCLGGATSEEYLSSDLFKSLYNCVMHGLLGGLHTLAVACGGVLRNRRPNYEVHHRTGGATELRCCCRCSGVATGVHPPRPTRGGLKTGGGAGSSVAGFGQRDKNLQQMVKCSRHRCSKSVVRTCAPTRVAMLHKTKHRYPLIFWFVLLLETETVIWKQQNWGCTACVEHATIPTPTPPLAPPLPPCPRVRTSLVVVPQAPQSRRRPILCPESPPRAARFETGQDPPAPPPPSPVGPRGPDGAAGPRHSGRPTGCVAPDPPPPPAVREGPARPLSKRRCERRTLNCPRGSGGSAPPTILEGSGVGSGASQ